MCSTEPRKAGARKGTTPDTGLLLVCVPTNVLRFGQKASLKHLFQNKLFICICSINIDLIYICTYWIPMRHPVRILSVLIL